MRLGLIRWLKRPCFAPNKDATINNNKPNVPIIVFSEEPALKTERVNWWNMCKNVRGPHYHLLGPLAFVWPRWHRKKKHKPNRPRVFLPLVPLNSMLFLRQFAKDRTRRTWESQRSQNVIVPIVVKFLLKLTFFFWDFYVFVPKDESPSSNGRRLHSPAPLIVLFLFFIFKWDTL